MIEIKKLQEQKEKAVLIAVITQQQNESKTHEYLDELAFLASTINIDTQKVFTQKLDTPDKRTFIGKGKLEEIQIFIKDNETDVVIFDDELSPSQVRNLENELKIKIYDRSLLILDIFLFRAQTAQAKTQVELARAQYLLPRLTRMWTHLERQRGGTGTRGGAGEKEIETDRRMIRDKITRLKQKLEKIDRQSLTQRKGRDKLVRVSLVGYTNVGKSTLMNIMTKAEVFAENKLFATVDSTVRKVVISTIPFLLTDTVGFIRKLPHGLIECFKSTLDEVREADILVHVVDLAHDSFQDHINVVNNTLKEIKAYDKPTILVFNKLDAFEEKQQFLLEKAEERSDEESFEIMSLDDISKGYSNENTTPIFISATQKIGITELRRLLFEKVSKKHYTIFPNFLKTDFYE